MSNVLLLIRSAEVFSVNYRYSYYDQALYTYTSFNNALYDSFVIYTTFLLFLLCVSTRSMLRLVMIAPHVRPFP